MAWTRPVFGVAASRIERLPAIARACGIGLLIITLACAAARQYGVAIDISGEGRRRDIRSALTASAGVAERLIDGHSFKTAAGAQPYLDTLRRVRDGCRDADAQAILTRDIADLERLMAALHEAEQMENIFRFAAGKGEAASASPGKLVAPSLEVDVRQAGRTALHARHQADLLARQMHDRIAPPDPPPGAASAARRPAPGVVRRGFSS